MKRTVPLSLLLVLLLVATPAARATYDPLGGGVTRLLLDKRFDVYLEQAGVRIDTRAGARKRGRSVVFQVSGGHLDPAAGAGEIEQQGSLLLRSSRSKLLVRKLAVKTAYASLVAKVGGSQLKVATLAGTDSRRAGFGTVFSVRKLRLTAKVVTRLNKKLRPRRPFTVGQVLGTLVSEPQPLVTTIAPAGRATLVFDSGFMAKLDHHFVSVNPVFPAEHVGPTFTLPIIAGGTLAPDASQGIVRTGGEVEFLQLGAGQVFWHELWFDVGLELALAEVDVEPTPAFPGKLGQASVLNLGEGAVSSDPQVRTIGLAGSPLTLPAATAAIFNQAFADGNQEFNPGELVGTLSFQARAQ